MSLKEKIVQALKEVYDPEIPINVYDLGLIYEITVKKNNNVHILMSLTSPTCPTADFIKEMIHDAVKEVDTVKEVEVELTFEPKWTPDRVSKEAKEELGLTEEEIETPLQNVFESNDISQKEKVCFNCGATQNEFPIIECFYKNETTFICAKCMSKFK